MSCGFGRRAFESPFDESGMRGSDTEGSETHFTVVMFVMFLCHVRHVSHMSVFVCVCVRVRVMFDFSCKHRVR